MARIGRLTFPISMLAFPFYLMSRSPGKQGSHYDPEADLFVASEAPLVSRWHLFATIVPQLGLCDDWCTVLLCFLYALLPCLHNCILHEQAVLLHAVTAWHFILLFHFCVHLVLSLPVYLASARSAFVCICNHCCSHSMAFIWTLIGILPPELQLLLPLPSGSF